MDDTNYLSTALRLSLPGLAYEPTEEEIMKDVQDLENESPPMDYVTNKEYDVHSVKQLDENPAKRYVEFVGKRYDEFPGKRSPTKRYLEFPGKRWAEFPGKRADENENINLFEYHEKGSSNSKAKELSDYNKLAILKRYNEFIGKRVSDTVGVSKQNKRWAEFLGKRTLSPINGVQNNIPYMDKASDYDSRYAKRYVEFIG